MPIPRRKKSAYQEALDFIIADKTPEQVRSFQFSPETRYRIAYLEEAERNGELTIKEWAELSATRDALIFVKMRKRQAEQDLGLNP